jgi:peptidoglycan/LPS O-acetylase OafA/YrhL
MDNAGTLRVPAQARRFGGLGADAGGLRPEICALMTKVNFVLSNLRGYTILMVVAFHSFIAYLAWTPADLQPFDAAPYRWLGAPIIDRARWFAFDLFCAFQYVYLMHLMFFLSGLFVWPSLVRKGGIAFLRDRLLRLGVPFLLVVVLLMPLVHYPIYRIRAADPSWSAYWEQWLALPFWPCGPAWFLSFLLVLDIAALTLYWLAPRAGAQFKLLSAAAAAHPARLFVVLVTASAFAYIPVAGIYKPWDWLQFGIFAFQPAFALQYVVFFFAGVAVGAQGVERGLFAADGPLARHWVHWLVGMPVGFLLWIVPTALVVTATGPVPAGLQVVADLGFVLSSATACFGLAAVFSRFGARPWPVFDRLSANAYGIYLVHYLYVIWLQYLLLALPLFAIAKAAIVLTASLALSWATSAAVSSFPVGAWILRGQQTPLASASLPAKGGSS